MRVQLLVCLLLAAIVCAQTPQPQAPAAPANGAPSGAQANPSQPSAPEPPKVNADDPVITIKGLCTDSSLKGDACKTVITKEQFEKLTDSIQPGMAPPMRRQFANRYSQVLTMSTEAEKRGLDKSPHYEDSIRLARMQILSQELTKTLQADAGNVSDQEIQDYYQKNAANYEEASLIKIFVPHTKRVEVPPAKAATKTGSTEEAAKPAAKKLSPEEQEKAGAEAMKKEASLLRERLVKGEDPDKLEKAAFVAAGLPGNPPPTKMDKIRRTSLPASQQPAMELKPGNVSEVISDASGNYIYKLVSKDTLPVDSVKTEIRNQLSAQHYRESMQHFQGNAEFNDAYFGPARNPGMPMPGQGMGKPGAPKDNDRDRD